MNAAPMPRPLGEMQARARRTSRALRPRRREVRIWIPLTLLLALLAPFALLLAALLALPLAVAGVNAFAAAWALGRTLLAAGGTLVDVETRDVLVRMKLV